CSCPTVCASESALPPTGRPHSRAMWTRPGTSCRETELGGLGPGEEPKWDERRPEARRDVHRRRRPLVERLGVAPAQVREPELPESVRDRDLAVVEVAGEHQAERPLRQAIEDGRNMAQEDPEVGVAVDVAPRLRAPPAVCARIDPDDLDAPAA